MTGVLFGKEELLAEATGIAPSGKAVIGALDNCYNPCCREYRISVVGVGLIESVEIRDCSVKVDLVLTTSWCPFASRLLEMVEGEIGSLPEVNEVDVDDGRGEAQDPGREPPPPLGHGRRGVTA